MGEPDLAHRAWYCLAHYGRLVCFHLVRLALVVAPVAAVAAVWGWVR